MTPHTAVLFLTHEWDETKWQRVSRLQSEIGALANVYLLAQRSSSIETALTRYPPPTRRLITFNPADLPGYLGYPFAFENSLTPGSVHFTVLAFSRRKTYSHYFLVEYDVEFSGNWGDLIRTIVAASPDLASFHLKPYDQRPSWPWWFFRPGGADRDWAGEKTNLHRSFNPFLCLSQQATDLIHQAHRDGWRAHHEMLLATVLSRRGCRVMDIAELGDFCVGDEQEHSPPMQAHALSTMRWRPKITKEEFLVRAGKHTVFHPVKDAWYFDGTDVVTVGEASRQSRLHPSPGSGPRPLPTRDRSS